jgi:hypothetical protein
MPKPQLLPLTGGYRRIPVLQLGADVYCDSQLIVRVLERLHPKPTIYPGGSEGVCHALSLWADRIFFFTTTVILFDLIGDNVPKAFIDDRTKMMGGRANFADLPKQAPYAKAQCRAFADMLAARCRRPSVPAVASSASPTRRRPSGGSCAASGTAAIFGVPRRQCVGRPAARHGAGERTDMNPARRCASRGTPATVPRSIRSATGSSPKPAYRHARRLRRPVEGEVSGDHTRSPAAPGCGARPDRRALPARRFGCRLEPVWEVR